MNDNVIHALNILYNPRSNTIDKNNANKYLLSVEKDISLSLIFDSLLVSNNINVKYYALQVLLQVHLNP